MFYQMRRSDRGIQQEQAEILLEKGLYGILSTAGENGYAYGVPLNYAKIGSNIYFHSAREGHKLDNIRHNNRVSFCIVGDTRSIPEKFSYGYESVIVFGTASEVEGDEKQEALTALIRKYAPDYFEKGLAYIKKDMDSTIVVKISVETITGKARL